MGGLRRAFMQNHLMTTKANSTNKKFDISKEENIIEWLTLF